MVYRNIRLGIQKSIFSWIVLFTDFKDVVWFSYYLFYIYLKKNTFQRIEMKKINLTKDTNYL